MNIDDVRVWFQRFEKVMHHQHFRVSLLEGSDGTFVSLPGELHLASGKEEAGPACRTGPLLRQSGVFHQGLREVRSIEVQGAHPVGFDPSRSLDTLCVLRRSLSVGLLM